MYGDMKRYLREAEANLAAVDPEVSSISQASMPSLESGCDNPGRVPVRGLLPRKQKSRAIPGVECVSLPPAPQQPAGYIRMGLRFTGGRARIFELADLISVKAQGNYVLLQAGPGSHLIRKSIAHMERALSQYGFVRIHRSVLVKAAAVLDIQRGRGGTFSLRTIDGRQWIVSRMYANNLKLLASTWLGNISFLSNRVKRISA